MFRLFSIVVACALLVAVCATPSEASLTLLLDAGGGNSVIVADDGTGSDLVAGDGVINYSGSLGLSTWTVNVTTGVSKPTLGTATLPNMDLNTLNISTSGSGSLLIALSDDDFVGANPAVAPLFKFDVGGTTGDNSTVTANAYASNTNVLFATDENIGSLGPFTQGAFAGTTRTPTTQTTGANYSLTIITTIQHSGGTSITSFDAQLQAVPEPASIAAWSLLASMGVAGLVWSRRRR